MRVGLFFLALVAAAPVLADSSLPPAHYAYTQLEDPAQEAKAKALMNELRCLVCNLSQRQLGCNCFPNRKRERAVFLRALTLAVRIRYSAASQGRQVYDMIIASKVESICVTRQENICKPKPPKWPNACVRRA